MSKLWTLTAAAAIALAIPKAASAGAAEPIRAPSAESASEAEQTDVNVIIEVPHPDSRERRRREVEPPPPPAPAPPPPPTVRRAPELPSSHTAHRRACAKKKEKKRFRFRLSLGFDMLPIKIDVAIHDRLSLHAGAFLVYPGENANYYGGLLGGLDYYFTGRAPEGLRLGLRAGQIAWGRKNGDGKKTRLAMARAIVGYNWIWQNGFTLNLGLGMQYIRKHYKGSTNAEPKNYIFPHLELGLGVAF